MTIRHVYGIILIFPKDDKHLISMRAWLYVTACFRSKGLDNPNYTIIKMMPYELETEIIG